MEYFFTNKGHFHLGIVLIVALLCVIGLWSLIQWQKEDKVKENLALMVSDIQTLSEKVVTDPKDRERIALMVVEMQQIISKYPHELTSTAIKQYYQDKGVK